MTDLKPVIKRPSLRTPEVDSLRKRGEGTVGGDRTELSRITLLMV